MVGTTSVTKIPNPWVLSRTPEESVARVTLGLTLYLDQPLAWAQQGAAEALQGFLQRIEINHLKWFTTSMLPEWRPFRSGAMGEILRGLSSQWVPRPRHLLWVRLVDDFGAPSVGFSYREARETPKSRAGFLQLFFPVTTHPDDVEGMALQLINQWPVLSGVGGFVVSWNPRLKGTAFWPAYAWCRRYFGLDVQDPDAMAWHGRTGLPGSGWLTLVGSQLAKDLELDLDAVINHHWTRSVHIHRARGGLLVRAGPSPTLGDSNQLQYPEAYGEVARYLGPWFVEEPPEFRGGFQEKTKTQGWFRRFIEPEQWR